MAVREREIYQSANRWLLCRDDDRLFVLHRANEPFGGNFTPMELGDFLRKGNAGREHQALRHMIGSLLDEYLRDNERIKRVNAVCLHKRRTRCQLPRSL